MGRLLDWASGGDSVPRAPRPAPLQPAPPEAPRILVQPQSPPRPQPIVIASTQAHRPVIVRAPYPTSTCVLVKGGQPEWDAMMRQIPDLAAEQGVDLSNGVDATRDFTSVPEGAVMNKWTPHARYVNGKTDLTGAPLDGHLAQHGDSLADIRSSQGVPRRSGPNG